MPTTLTCEDFGLSQEQMLDRLIERMSERMLGLDADESAEDQENSYYSKTTVMNKLDAIIKDKVDAKVAAIADEHVIPHVHKLLEELAFQETNALGEPKKPKMTLREFIDLKATTYLSEQVNYKGKTKAEDSYSWRAEGSRLMHAVNSHLYDQLNGLIKRAAADVNSQFAQSVKDAVNLAVSHLKVSVNTKVK